MSEETMTTQARQGRVAMIAWLMRHQLEDVRRSRKLLVRDLEILIGEGVPELDAVHELLVEMAHGEDEETAMRAQEVLGQVHMSQCPVCSQGRMCHHVGADEGRV